MNLKLNDEQEMLRDTLRRYLREQYDFDTRRARRAEAGLDRRLWSALAEELGILSVLLPEGAGGMDGGAEEAMIVAEAFGEALVVEPFREVMIEAAGILKRSETDVAAALLPKLASGEAIAVLAHAEAGADLDMDGIQTRADRSGDGWRLTGKKPVAAWAPAADQLIVTAKSDDGPAIFLVPSKASGVSMRTHRLIDDRPAADISFEEVELPGSALLIGGNQAAETLELVLDEAAAALCAEATGLMRRMHVDTMAYTKDRKQFGQPLASFQVLQHRMVDMFMALEQAVAGTYLAVLSLAAPAAERKKAVSAAKATAIEAVRFVSQNAVQLHGAMGMTDELPVGHFFRRAAAMELELGTADDHVRRYAELVRDAA